MPIILQEKLICWILRPLSHITERIPERVRDAAFSLSILGIILMEFSRESGLYEGRFLYQYIIAYALFGVMILSGLTPSLKPMHFSPVLTVCWLIISAFMVLSGTLVRSDGLAEAILWLGLFPVLYLVWNNHSFDRMFRLIFYGMASSFLVFLAVSIFFFPIDTINYGSFFLNRNGASVYLVGVFVCVLTYVLSVKAYSLRVFAADLLLGFIAATIYYTGSRTGMLAVILCLIFTSLLQFFLCRKDRCRFLLYNLLPVILAIVLLIPSAIYIYSGGYQMKVSIQAAIASSAEYFPMDPAPVESPASVLDTIVEYNEHRIDSEEKNLDDYTSGRVGLWRIYLKEAGFLGNPSDKILYNGEGKVEGRSAHFTIIMYAYNFGIFAGLFFFVLNILAGLSSIRYAINSSNRKYYLFPFAVAIAYGVNSVTETLISPATIVLCLLYFLSLTPLVSRSPRSKQKKIDSDYL